MPDAYRLPDGAAREAESPLLPQVVFIEVTNRCNLVCQTCPRTYFDREPPKSLSHEEFVQIAEQFPQMRRALLHGIGEPLLNRALPQIIETLKARGVEVIINSNGTLLTASWQQALVRSGLDEFRCSIDAAQPATYARIRGADLLPRLLRGLKGLVESRARAASATPRISIWMVVTQENLTELPQLVRLAAQMGVDELYVQRMVFFAQAPEEQYGMAREEMAIFGQHAEAQEAVIAECEALSAQHGLDFRASGARDPRNSLAAARAADFAPWQACMRPWTSAYVTANGNCLACCIAPFATGDYPSLLLGNLLETSFAELWNGAAYQAWRAALLSKEPHKACGSCGVYWSL